MRNIKIALLTVLLLAVMPWALSGCGKESTAKGLVLKAAAAIEKISTYKVDKNITVDFIKFSGSFNPDENQYSGTTIWHEQGSYDIENKKMTSSYSERFATNHVLDTITTPIDSESYIIGNFDYMKSISPGGGHWTKNPIMNQNLPDYKFQQQSILDFLTTAARISLTGIEYVDGIDCYILYVQPSRAACANWSFNVTGPHSDPAAMTNNYRNSWINLWLSRDSYRIIKADINLYFSDNDNLQNIVFHGQIHFCDYDQPFSIDLPQEALNAKEY